MVTVAERRVISSRFNEACKDMLVLRAQQGKGVHEYLKAGGGPRVVITYDISMSPDDLQDVLDRIENE